MRRGRARTPEGIIADTFPLTAGFPYQGTLLPRLPYSPPGRCTAREYLDSEDFAGPLRRLFDGAMAFIQRNLRKAQADAA